MNEGKADVQSAAGSLVLYSRFLQDIPSVIFVEVMTLDGYGLMRFRIVEDRVLLALPGLDESEPLQIPDGFLQWIHCDHLQ